MRKGLFLVALLAVSLIPGPIAHADHAFRCGRDLVSLGDSTAKVMMICGEPTSREVIGFDTWDRSGVVRPYGEGNRQADRGRNVESTRVAERWYYNCGRNDFLYVLTFNGGILRTIESEGYGTGKSDCGGAERRRIKSGDITILGSPEGAAVYLDDGYVGEIPCYLYKIATGIHSIRVARVGFRDEKEWVQVKPGERVTVIIELTPDE